MTPDTALQYAPLFETMVASFEGLSLRMDVERATRSAHFTITNDTVTVRVVARTFEEMEIAQVWAALGVVIPADRRPLVSELLHRINDTLAVGNFEFDVDKGVVRYKSTLVAHGATVSVDSFERILRIAVLMAEKYAPAVLSVAFGDSEPAAALACAQLT